MQKYIDEKCLYCSSFFCFLTLHAGTGGIHRFLGFLIMLVFQSRISNQLFAVNARNSLKSLAVSSDSEPEVEPFITQTKAALVAVLQELSENNLNLHLRVQKTSKQLTISIFTPRIFRRTCLFTNKEDSGRGITTVPDNEIQSRNEARIPRNPKRSTTCLHGVYTRVWDDWLKNGTPYHDSNTFVEPQNFKDAVQFQTFVLAVEIDEPTTKKIRECGAKETQLGLILVIIVSC